MQRLRLTMESARTFLHHLGRRVFPMRWLHVGERVPSMILLLRNPHVFSDEDIQRAAERAWAVSFSAVEGSTRRVVETKDAIFLQAELHRFSFVNCPRPYEDSPQKDLDWPPQLSQQRAWAAHTACCWVYYMTKETDLELAHCLLARVVAQLVDENCTGVFIPSEKSLIPAEAAFMELHNMGMYRSASLVPKP